MSINWVMLNTSTSTFTPLPAESTLYTSPPRTSLSIQSPAKASAEAFSVSSASGTLYLTNRRLVYLPASPTAALASFAAPLLNCHDSHITTPWIGPNAWTALVRPVSGGNIPVSHPVEVKLTFKDGGAYEFQTRYERVRERLQAAVDVARTSGTGEEVGRARGGGAMEGVDVGNVHLEELPRYEDAAQTVHLQGPQESRTDAPRHERDDRPVRPRADAEEERAAQSSVGEPNEPPPSYENVQREVIEDEFSRRLSEAKLE